MNAPPQSSRLIIRTLTAHDIANASQLSRASGWNQSEDDWRIFVEFPQSGGFLAERDGAIAGTVAYIGYGSLCWIAMMLVHPSERRKGIGSQLMEQVLAALADVASVGLDATPAGEFLYHRFGFVKHYGLIRTKARIEASRFCAARPARPMEIADLPAVLKADREIFGADRGPLLTTLFGRAPESAWIVRQHDSIRGYMFGRPGHLYHQLGPIVAERVDIACALVETCCPRLEGRQVAIDATLFDAAWTAWLESVGFVEERAFVRMFRGADRHPGIPARQYAITGPEFA